MERQTRITTRVQAQHTNLPAIAARKLETTGALVNDFILAIAAIQTLAHSMFSGNPAIQHAVHILASK